MGAVAFQDRWRLHSGGTAVLLQMRETMLVKRINEGELAGHVSVGSSVAIDAGGAMVTLDAADIDPCKGRR
jgi:hypothetical protein